MAHHIKKLDDAGLSKLQALERKLGCCIVALERQPWPATLSKTQNSIVQLEFFRCG
jgi:hypothetical protein